MRKPWIEVGTTLLALFGPIALWMIAAYWIG